MALQSMANTVRAGRVVGAGFKVMNVTLNGENSTLRDGISLAELLAERKLLPMRVAVEVNEELVPRRKFNDVMLREGDRVEIVTFVGGG